MIAFCSTHYTLGAKSDLSPQPGPNPRLIQTTKQPMNIPQLTFKEAAGLMDVEMPSGFARGRRQVAVDAFGESWPLTAEDVAVAKAHVESGAVIGVVNPDLKALRNTHHRLAQLLAMGMDEVKAGVLCNYTASRVSILKSDPAFSELLAYYKSEVDAEFADFVTTAKELSLDFLGLLQQQLDETPEKFTPGMALEAIRTLADRSGNAPVARSVNVSVNTNLGERMAAARQRVNGQ